MDHPRSAASAQDDGCQCHAGIRGATIKPSNPDQPGWGINVNPSGIFTTRNTTVSDLVKFAYDLHPKQVAGAPRWFDSDKFDVTAKPDKPGIPGLNQMKAWSGSC